MFHICTGKKRTQIWHSLTMYLIKLSSDSTLYSCLTVDKLMKGGGAQDREIYYHKLYLTGEVTKMTTNLNGHSKCECYKSIFKLRNKNHDGFFLQTALTAMKRKKNSPNFNCNLLLSNFRHDFTAL